MMKRKGSYSGIATHRLSAADHLPNFEIEMIKEEEEEGGEGAGAEASHLGAVSLLESSRDGIRKGISQVDPHLKQMSYFECTI